jgi:5-methylcytosine-specific restriction protein A
VDPSKLYCPEHSPIYSRPATARGYGSEWNRERKKYLDAHPLCVQCLKQGRFTKATVVDHIKPHRGDRLLFWDRDNWQALCKACHDKKTGNEDSRPLYHY